MSERDDTEDQTQSFFQIVPGALVSHYRIIEKIGAGGMGEVYLAQDTELDRNVALKFLPPHLCQDEDCRKRFKREAQAAAKLDHPNVVTVHEVGEFQQRPYFVMQHVEGSLLKDVIKEARLSIERIVELSIQICDGLREAHEADIIHRDIKPTNILIDSKGRPKLVDFGLAAVVGTTKITKTGSTLGTVGYMSPEQAEGKEVDERSDLFSFGVVLYEMITGHRPFDRESDVATSKAIVTDQAEPLLRYKSGVPDQLQRIVTKLLEKDPGVRYQSAAGVLSDLKPLSVSGTRPSVVSSRVNRITAFRWAIALLGLIIIVVWGGTRVRHWLAPAEPRAKSLAVVDFDNVGPEEDAYLASGLAEDLSIKLRQLEGIQVASSADIRRLARENLLPREIASRLKVQYALGGSLLREDTLVRVNVELIDRENGDVVWSDQIDKQFTEIFQFLDEVSLKVAQALQVRLTPVEEIAMAVNPTDNTAAYDHYLKGRHYYYNITYRDNDLAEKEFERALHIDPDYPLALAGQADVYVQRYKESFDYDEYWLDSAKVLIEKALAFKPHSAEAHESSAELNLVKENITEALRAAERARELRPDWDEPYIHLADIYRQRGLRDTAISLYNRANGLRPSVDALCGKGEIAQTRGQVDSAEALYRAASELNPYHDRPYLLLASLYEETHEGERVDSLLRRAIEVRPDHVTGYQRLCHRLYRRGSTQESEDLLREFVRRYPYNWEGYWALYLFVKTWRGDYRAAVPIIEEAIRRNPEEAWAYAVLAYNYAGFATSKGDLDEAGAAREKALDAIQTAISMRPHSAAILDWAGSVYIELGYPEKAVTFLERALQSGSLSSRMLNEIAWSFYLLGQYEKAVEIAHEAVTQSPGIAEYNADLGSLMEEVYRSIEYLGIIEDAASRYGDDPDFFVYLSEAQRSEGRFKEAISSAKRALAVKPGHPTLIHLGLSQWFSGDVKSALETLKKASDEDDSGHWIIRILKSEERWDEIESYLKTIKEPRSDRVSGIVQWATIATPYYMSMRRYDDALNVLIEFRNSGNETWAIWNSQRMAECYLAMGRIDSAIHILTKLSEEASVSQGHEIAEDRALLSAALKQDLDVVLENIKSVRGGVGVPNDPLNAQILRLQFAAGHLNDAAGTLELISPRGTWIGNVAYRQAQLAAVTGSNKAAMYLEHAIIDLSRISCAHLYWTPEFGIGVSYYALALARAEKLEDARKEIKWALKLEPERADIAYNAACAYSLLGDTTLALQWLQTAVERNYLELWWAKVDPDLDPLRNLPRFKEIIDDWDNRIQAMIAKSG